MKLIQVPDTTTEIELEDEQYRWTAGFCIGSIVDETQPASQVIGGATHG